MREPAAGAAAPGNSDKCESTHTLCAFLHILLLQHAGHWNFHIGVPATCGSSGALMVRPEMKITQPIAARVLLILGGLPSRTYVDHHTWWERLRHLQIVVPNVMGLVVYQPSAGGDTGVSPKSEAFCRSLVSKYPINFFDQLVHDDEDVRAKGPGSDVPADSEEDDPTCTRCAATRAGRMEEVRGVSAHCALTCQ